MNSPDDPVKYLSCTILGLKTALLEAEKENQNLQKALLSFYVKDAARETNLYKINRTGAKMNEIFQKEKQDMNLRIRDLEARLSDMEKENINLNFQIKELKAFLEEKTNLLQLYNPKNAKSEKLILNTLKEKDLLQIIRNVLVCMKDGRISRELRKSLRKLDQRKDKNLKKTKHEDIEIEMSDDEVDLMSSVVESRLREDEFSMKNEGNSFQLIHKHRDHVIGSSRNGEMNSSHSNAMDCTPLDQSIFSPSSITDSDYSSNGVKSVDSLNLERLQSAESSCETNTLSAELGVSDLLQETLPNFTDISVAPNFLQETLPNLTRNSVASNSIQETLPNLTEVSVDVTQSDESVSDREEILECDQVPFLDRKILNSVINLVLNEMMKICYPNSIVEDFEEFCKNDICLNLDRNNTSSLMHNSDESPELASTSFSPTVQSVPQNITHEPVPIKRKMDISSQNNNLKKVRLDENLSNSTPESSEIIFISESNTNVEKITDLADEANKTLLPVQNENAENIPILKDNIIETYSKLEHQEVFKPENAAMENTCKATMIKSIQLGSIMPNLDIHGGTTVLSSKNELVLNSHECLETSILETRTLESCRDESSISNSTTLVSIFDVPNSETNIESTPSMDSVTILNEEIPACDDSDISSPILENQNFSEVCTASTIDNETTSAQKIHFSSELSNSSIEKLTFVDHRNDDDVCGKQENCCNMMDEKCSNLVDHASEDVSKRGGHETNKYDGSSAYCDNSTNSNKLVEVCAETVDYTKDAKSISSMNVAIVEGIYMDDVVSSTKDQELNDEISTENNFNISEISTEKELNANVEQRRDIEVINGKNEETSAHETEKPSLFHILNEFRSLEERMREITVFEEFMLQDEKYDGIEKLDEVEYIVVAEILDDSDLELPDREGFIDNSSSLNDVIHSLHMNSLKTVELPTSKETNRLSKQPFIVPLFNSVVEVNEASDDEKDELIIVEDHCIDNDSDADSVLKKDGILNNEEHNSKLLLTNLPEKQALNSSDVHSVLKNDQPIKEITNLPRYNFRRLPASSNSACETSYSLTSSPVENSVHLFERNSDFVTSAVEEPSKCLEMKFYVENQLTMPNSSWSVSVFDEVWSKIKLHYCENLSRVIPENTALVPCRSSVIKSALLYKNHRKDLKMQDEEILNLAEVKKSLEVFMLEKIRNYALAFSTFSSTACRANKTTLCCVVTDTFRDSLNARNARIKENILRDFVNLSYKLDSTIFPGFIEALKNYLKTRIWAKDWVLKANGGSVVVYLRLYSSFFTRICKFSNDSQSVISLLHESLFSLKFRAHPIAFGVLTEWPDIFPRNPEQRNLLTHIILFSLVNHKMDYNNHLYNVEDVHTLVNTLFNVKLGMKTAEEYVKEMMLHFSDNTWNDAITLLCKRQMFPWTYTNVIMKYFLPILKKWRVENYPEEVLNKTLLALRILLRACPVSYEENEMYKLDSIIKTLKEILSERGSRELKENVILILYDLSSMRFLSCAEILLKWKPDDELISLNTIEQLNDRITKYASKWRGLLNPKGNVQNAPQSRLRAMKLSNERHSESNLCPEDSRSVITVGVSKKLNKKLNKNRSVPDKSMTNGLIRKKAKKKRNKKNRQNK